MSAAWASQGNRDLRGILRPFVSCAVALLIALSASLPNLQAWAAVPGIAVSDQYCPLHQDAGRDTGCCILCAMPSLSASPSADPYVIPLRLSHGVALHFATGVSATHGPELTANLATGPPAA